MREFGIGQSVPRVEDRRLLTGRGHFPDDRRVPGAYHLAPARSPPASARVPTPYTSLPAPPPGVDARMTAEGAKAGGHGTRSGTVQLRIRPRMEKVGQTG